VTHDTSRQPALLSCTAEFGRQAGQGDDTMSFQLIALPAEGFQHLADCSEEDLERLGVCRVTAAEKPGYPCRVSLADAEVGETVYVLTYTHHDVTSPYRSAGPIFVRAGVETAVPAVNEIPLMFRHRLLSIRGYDEQALMVGADVVRGEVLEEAIKRLFDDSNVSYLHIHNAKPGCFNCRVVRA
jgi:hypothetical protein